MDTHVILSRLGFEQKARLKEMFLEDIHRFHLDLERTDNERVRGKIEYIRKLLQYMETKT